MSSSSIHHLMSSSSILYSLSDVIILYSSSDVIILYSSSDVIISSFHHLMSVRVTWENVFPRGAGCGEVEFLIKSHPLAAPSNYKLSDLTLKGKRTAVLAVPPGEDFIFQVIIVTPGT